AGAVAAVLAAAPAAAQTAPAAQAPTPVAEAADSTTTLPGNEIVVVGTTGAGKKRQDAAFALTTVDASQLTKLAPASTADLLKVVPGVSAETS
ncbi:hypothetical protein ABTB83_19190, partial [Acinetobacter baumannii]